MFGGPRGCPDAFAETPPLQLGNTVAAAAADTAAIRYCHHSHASPTATHYR